MNWAGLSSHQAATLAGVSRGEFLQLLRTYQIPPFEHVDATGAPIRPLPELADAEVLRLATMHMPPWQSRRLDEIVEHQREGQLTPEEQVELAHLLRLHDSALLLKSEAMVEAVRRGLCARQVPARDGHRCTFAGTDYCPSWQSLWVLSGASAVCLRHIAH